jgi:hypothetical protein
LSPTSSVEVSVGGIAELDFCRMAVRLAKVIEPALPPK